MLERRILRNGSEMMNEKTKRNLVDAGCSEEFISEFDGCICNKKECIKMLAQHRRELLGEVHAKERNIECLDYLVYKIGKEGIEELSE